MNALLQRLQLLTIVAVACLLTAGQASAQTDIDAIMMTKNNYCTGLMYSHSAWTNYWEGTYKRDNANLGKVSTQMLGIMGNYGISDKLNLLFSLPYVKTQASAGTLHGMQGLQDLSLWAKWMPIEKTWGKGTFSLYGIGGVSFPVSNYTPDFLPMSIGLHSTNLTSRLLVDYQLKSWFVSASGSYVYRSNVTIDRNAYYTTSLHLTNKVQMGDMVTSNIRAGYRTGRMIAEAILNTSNTLTGFDIRKNDMPFPSNQMNATTLGVNLKYNLPQVDGLSLIAGGNYVVAGRNMGQATTLNGGIFYIIDFTHKPTPAPAPTK